MGKHGDASGALLQAVRPGGKAGDNEGVALGV